MPVKNTSTIQEKKALRTQINQALKSISEQDLMERSEKLWEKLLQEPVFQSSQHILAYWSYGQEVHTQQPLLSLAKRKKIWLPRIQGEHLQICRFEGLQSMKAEPAFGILEPIGTVCQNLQDIDLVVVPGLAFTASGKRLGKGKAYYDRLLPQLSQAKTIALAFSEQIVPDVPVEAHDVTIDKILVV